MFLLARHIENDLPRWSGHGERLAGCLAKLGAFLAGRLALGFTDLEALCLAARVQGLGLVQLVDREEPRSPRRSVPAHVLRELLRTGEGALPGLDPEILREASRILDASLRDREGDVTEDDEHRLHRLVTLFEIADLWARAEGDALASEDLLAEVAADPGLDAATAREAVAALKDLAARD